MEAHQNTQPPSPHVLIFPLPIQGPVNCMLKLAQLILNLTQPTTTTAAATVTVTVTFLTTEFIHRRLALHSPAATRLIKYEPHFRFETVSAGLGPDENPRGTAQIASMTNFLADQAQDKGSRLREVLAYGSAEPGFKKPVTCLIADGFFGFMVDVAEELGVPLVYFETVSPCGLWTYLNVPKMLQAGELPFQGQDLDAPITSVPGMETYLKRRDLPSFCRRYDPQDPIIKLILKKAHNFSRAQAHILNTFDELEPDYFYHIRALCPNLYNIGPLHLNLKSRVITNQETINSFSNSLWQEDKSCLAWLDAQPPKSVLFVSIGSLAVMTKEQLMEIWYGLVKSKAKYLWTIRPGSVVGSNNEVGSEELEAMKKVLEGTKDRGYIVNWAPQEDVLAHSAIGGFFTHSGWKSTLESIVEGVPMICWPFFVDQQMNSRFVSEVWKIGVDIKHVCDSVVVEKMIKEVMGTRRDEFLKRANDLAKLSAQAVGNGGSSFNNLNRLIDDINFMRFPISVSNNLHNE